MKAHLGIPLLLFLGLIVACVPRWTHDAYLANVVEQVIGDQVKLQMGPPDEVKKKNDGGEEWRYREYQPNYPAETPGTCSEYILRFDQKQVLRDWKRKDCGEKAGK